MTVIGSLSGVVGTGQTAYAACKAGVLGLVKSAGTGTRARQRPRQRRLSGWQQSPLAGEAYPDQNKQRDHVLTRTPALDEVADLIYHVATAHDVSGKCIIWTIGYGKDRDNAGAPTPKGLFITGTDTNVGKTVVDRGTGARVATDRSRRWRHEPVETGYTRILGNPRLTVAALRQSVAPEDPIELVSPYCFPSPTAPLHAARLAGQTIACHVILDRLLRARRSP